MAYSNFTLDTVLEAFDLEEIGAVGIFAASEPVKPSELLTAVSVTKSSVSSQVWLNKRRRCEGQIVRN